MLLSFISNLIIIILVVDVVWILELIKYRFDYRFIIVLINDGLGVVEDFIKMYYFLFIICLIFIFG